MKIEIMNLIANELNDVDVIKNMISAYDNLSEEDINKILTALKECECNDKVLLIAANSKVLEKRTIEKQIKLMGALKECGYEDNALKLAINPNILEKITVEEQIELMKPSNNIESKKYETHSQNLDKIKTLEVLRKYINDLQKEYGSETDIKTSDNVKKYK